MDVPAKIDGAIVLFYARSGAAPFFTMGGSNEDVHGLAICRYEGSQEVYRFSCDANWECLHDSMHETVQEALRAPSGDYDIEQVAWHPASC